MLVETFSAGPWETNCYIVAPNQNSECIIIDPGYQSIQAVSEIVSQAHLKPVAVLLTHGHLDHMWSVFPVAQGYDIPAIIHASDRHLISDPTLGISVETLAMLSQTLQVTESFVEPDEVIEINTAIQLDIAGLSMSITPAPGHTEGSIIFQIAAEVPTVFTGDVLFAGAIGRTDLPGGSSVAMNETLRNQILPIPDEATIHPGHGPSTTMAYERVNNPYLLRIAQGLNAV